MSDSDTGWGFPSTRNFLGRREDENSFPSTINETILGETSRVEYFVSARPDPYRLSFPASPISTAVFSKTSAISSAVIEGLEPTSKAASPAMCGVDAEVPKNGVE